MCYNLVLREGGRARLSYGWGFLVFEEPPLSIKKSLEIASWVCAEAARPLLITVGDVVTRSFLAHAYVNMAVIDRRTRRTLPGIEINHAEEFKCSNRPGTISWECYNTVSSALKRLSEGRLVVVRVDGEEDLLALVALKNCPESSWVVYGHWRGFISLIPCTPYFKRLAHVVLETYFEKERLE